MRLGLEFIANHIPGTVLLSKPTWANHPRVVERVGLKWEEYSYWDAASKGVNFDQLTNSLFRAAPGSIVLLHACAHNPTGVDLTADQWAVLAKLFHSKNLFPFFDVAYQGYATGDVERDVLPIKIFLDYGHQLIVTQSFAKNLGLYGERVGALHFVTKTKETAAKVLSQIK